MICAKIGRSLDAIDTHLPFCLGLKLLGLGLLS